MTYARFWRYPKVFVKDQDIILKQVKSSIRFHKKRFIKKGNLWMGIVITLFEDFDDRIVCKAQGQLYKVPRIVSNRLR